MKKKQVVGTFLAVIANAILIALVTYFGGRGHGYPIVWFLVFTGGSLLVWGLFLGPFETTYTISMRQAESLFAIGIPLIIVSGVSRSPLFGWILLGILLTPELYYITRNKIITIVAGIVGPIILIGAMFQLHWGWGVLFLGLSLLAWSIALWVMNNNKANAEGK